MSEIVLILSPEYIAKLCITNSCFSAVIMPRRKDTKTIKQWSDLQFPGAFSSSETFHKGLVKKYGKETKLKDTKKALQANILFQAHRDLQEHFPRRAAVSTMYGEKWEADLGDFGSKLPESLAGKLPKSLGQRNQLIFLLCVDTFSRKVYARGLANKESRTVTDAFEDILNELKAPEGIPRECETDKGSEFISQTFRNMCKEKGIRLVLATGANKARMSERNIRSIKRVIMAAVQTSSWPDNLTWDGLVRASANVINNRYNRVIKMSPNEVKDHISEIMTLNWQKKNLTPYVQYDKEQKALAEGRGIEENGQFWNIGDAVLMPIKKIQAGKVKAKEFEMHYDLMPRQIKHIFHFSRPCLFALINPRTGKKEPRSFYARELKKIKLPSNVPAKDIRSYRITRKNGLEYEIGKDLWVPAL